MNIDRDTVKYLREQLQKTLDSSFTEKKKFKVEVGNARFDSDQVTFKLCLSAIGKNGEVKNREAEEFERSATWYGLKPEDLGKVFTNAGVYYTIVGLKRSSKRYPILAQRADGKKYKFPADMIKAYLGRKNLSLETVKKEIKVVAKGGSNES